MTMMDNCFINNDQIMLIMTNNASYVSLLMAMMNNNVTINDQIMSLMANNDSNNDHKDSIKTRIMTSSVSSQMDGKYFPVLLRPFRCIYTENYFQKIFSVFLFPSFRFRPFFPCFSLKSYLSIFFKIFFSRVIF